ncbi:MAG: 2'-deoxycytidine 5'-triphosphate deaminase [Alphaproteobacteria bacterium]|jgi:dCTP deaminase|nr:2'-deoxycytidine 5'-triphosphate deaminase [Alphaproteobacteria bacterium]
MTDKAGVLPDMQLRELIASGRIDAETAFCANQVQPASLDLRLADDVYRIRASFLPGAGGSVGRLLHESDLQMHRMDISAGAVLETGCVYLALIDERLALPAQLSGRCNPKSSTGRLDIFTRVITDGAQAFDDIPAGYEGPLFLEICPRTFSVLARAGDRLAQLRLRRGRPAPVREIIFSVDLEAQKGAPVGWRARRHASLVDLQKTGRHAICDYWEPVRPHRGRVVLEPGEFYILASKETVKVPATQAAEMAPIAPELGEFRAHYAGFFDPGFGANDGGSRAVLEVRTRDVPFFIEDGQPVGRLVYEPMSARPAGLYGQAGSHYQGQRLRLSKHFARE